MHSRGLRSYKDDCLEEKKKMVGGLNKKKANFINEKLYIWRSFNDIQYIISNYISNSEYSTIQNCGLLSSRPSITATSSPLHSVSSDLLCLRVKSPWQQEHERYRMRGNLKRERFEGGDSFTNFWLEIIRKKIHAGLWGNDFLYDFLQARNWDSSNVKVKHHFKTDLSLAISSINQYISYTC